MTRSCCYRSIPSAVIMTRRSCCYRSIPSAVIMTRRSCCYRSIPSAVIVMKELTRNRRTNDICYTYCLNVYESIVKSASKDHGWISHRLWQDHSNVTSKNHVMISLALAQVSWMDHSRIMSGLSRIMDGSLKDNVRISPGLGMDHSRIMSGSHQDYGWLTQG